MKATDTELVRQIKAARRVSVPIVAIRTPDPTATIRNSSLRRVRRQVLGQLHQVDRVSDRRIPLGCQVVADAFRDIVDRPQARRDISKAINGESAKLAWDEE